VRASLVVVHTVLTKHYLQVPLVENQHPVQALPTAAADPAFGVGVRLRRHEWSDDQARTLRPEHPIRLRRELPVPRHG